MTDIVNTLETLPGFAAWRQTLQAETVVLVGLGREGWSSYSFLNQIAPPRSWLLVDDKPLAELAPHWGSVIEQTNTEQITTAELAARWRQAAQPASSRQPHTELIVKTPGLPRSHPVWQQLPATSHVTANTQLFFELTRLLPRSACRCIGVTGTKGKSTTTAAIHHVLKATNLPCLLGGNIGVPPLDLVADVVTAYSTHQPCLVVLELSCHQLAELPLSPEIAVIQNITPEHLDYYPDFARYVQAKAAICRYQTSDDMVLYDPTLEVPSRLAAASPARKLHFGIFDAAPATEPAATTRSHLNSFAANGQLWLTPFSSQKTPNTPLSIISLNELPVVGSHNYRNLLPSVSLGGLFGLSPEQIAAQLRSFRPLAHRLELVAQTAGTRFINDSLATTPEAASAAIASFPAGTVHLIAGGYDRHLEFDSLAQTILEYGVPRVVLFRPTGEAIARAIELARHNRQSDEPNQPHPNPEIVFAQTMQEAVARATQQLPANGVVLLSPASASFGQFRDYQDRGDQFTAAARAWTGPQT